MGTSFGGNTSGHAAALQNHRYHRARRVKLDRDVAIKLPSEMNSGIDPRLDKIICQSLQTDPDDRYSSAAELHQALNPIITSPMTRIDMEMEEEISSLPVKLEKEKSKTGLYVSVAVAALIVVGGLPAFLMNQMSDSEKRGMAIAAMDNKERVPVKSTLIDSSTGQVKGDSAKAKFTEKASSPEEKPSLVTKAQDQSIAQAPKTQVKADNTDTEIHPMKILPAKIVK